MAARQLEHGVELDRDQFCCSVCLDLLKEPVTVPCGHTYCSSCIDSCWNREEEQGRYSCPQCRELFQPRPVLRKNNILAEVVEKLKATDSGQTASFTDLPCASPEDVACDFCCGTRRYKASMSCLTCLVSYCAIHLEPHYKVPALKTHQLVSVRIPLHQKMCTKHNKLLEVYCRKDKLCICYLCSMDCHWSHRTVSAAAERAEEQKCLLLNQTNIQNRLQEREQELQELFQIQKDFKNSNQSAVMSIDKIMDDLISSIQARYSLVKQMIRTQEISAIARTKKLQFQLEEEINTLKKRNTDLEQLSQTDDHIHFLQTFSSLSTSCESPDLPLGAVVHPRCSMETVTSCVSDMKVNVENLLKETFPKISAAVYAVSVVPPLVPVTREEFIENCCVLTLDNQSLQSGLFISEEQRQVKFSCNHYYGSNSCTGQKQVLCREGLSERHYWEIRWMGRFCTVAVAYRDITSSQFGNNEKSWSLECSSSGYTFKHNYITKAVSGPSTCCIGVYLNYKAGTLSFYTVADEMTLIHREQTKFTQPLYPGIGLKCSDYHPCHAEVVKLW